MATNVLNPSDRKKSRLETLIERREARKQARAAREAKADEKRKTFQDRVGNEEFRTNFKKMFARLRGLVRCTFDTLYPRHAFFTYKEQRYSITYEDWFIPKYPGDVDDYDMSGTHWAIHKWNGGYAGHGHCIVDSTKVVSDKDYSGKVISMLAKKDLGDL